MRKGKRLTRVRALANKCLMSMNEERGKAQNTNRSRGLEEGIGSKLLSDTNSPKPNSDSVPLVLVKGQCFIQGDMKERGEEISSPFTSHQFLKFYSTPGFFIYRGRRKDG